MTGPEPPVIGLEVVGVSDIARASETTTPTTLRRHGEPGPDPEAADPGAAEPAAPLDPRDTPGAASARAAEWSFPGEPDTLGRARTVTRATLAAWGLNAVGDVTVLLVSELVTNSLRYASGPIGVRMERTRNRTLLVEVSDSLPDPPLTRTAAPDDEGGRGLQLVACASRRWGTRRARTGKAVWFELGLSG